MRIHVTRTENTELSREGSLFCCRHRREFAGRRIQTQLLNVVFAGQLRHFRLGMVYDMSVNSSADNPFSSGRPEEFSVMLGKTRPAAGCCSTVRYPTKDYVQRVLEKP